MGYERISLQSSNKPKRLVPSVNLNFVIELLEEQWKLWHIDKMLFCAGCLLRICRRTTAATLALFWIFQLSRWPRWIRRCLLFHPAIALGTCCLGTRHFRMMTGNVEKNSCLGYECLPRDIDGEACVCGHMSNLCSKSHLKFWFYKSQNVWILQLK